MRIGVFFDGTGNNASNTATGLLCGAQHPIALTDLDASCQPYMADPNSSYGNDVTNVHKLWSLYHESRVPEGDDEQKQAFLKVYIDGIGTTAGERDSLIGLGFGRGETGVVERVWGAFGRVRARINDMIGANPDIEITHLTFDTFGFSRGAAVARHFANEVAQGRQGPLGDTLTSHGKAFSRCFSDRDIRMGFIGLFDTVESVAGLDNLGNVRSRVVPGLRIYLPREGFPSVVHLVARDEYRLLSRRGRPLLAELAELCWPTRQLFAQELSPLTLPSAQPFPLHTPPRFIGSSPPKRPAVAPWPG